MNNMSAWEIGTFESIISGEKECKPEACHNIIIFQKLEHQK